MANPNYTSSAEQMKCCALNLDGAKKFHKNTLQSAVSFGIISAQSQKTIAERQNSNDLSLANSSTPLNRAFFVHSLRTSKENNRRKFASVERLSMVAYGGKGFALCCVPVIAVSDPVIRYRPKASELQAVTSNNHSLETPPMIYLFLGVHRQHLGNTALNVHTFPKNRIAIQAESEQIARAQLAKNWLLLQVWQFKNQAEIDRTCVKGVIYAFQGLPMVQNKDNIASTTTVNGKHYRYLSAFFIPKIPPLNAPEKSGELSFIEFAEWLISRDKPSNRTNKASRLTAVVETISHPTTGENHLLTTVKRQTTMKNPTQRADSAQTVTITPIAFTFNRKEVAYV